MRTTLTLDDDVAIAIERRRREHNHSLKDEVNELIRAGLLHVDREPPPTAPFRVEPLPVGELLIDVNDVTAALEIAEGSEQL